MEAIMRQIHDFAPSETNRRNSEGAFYRRWDGNIGFVYSKFLDGCEDFSRSVIAEAVLSPDGTELLDGERILFTAAQFSAQNVMCVSFVNMPDGRLLLFFCVRYGGGHINPWLYESYDGGQTFVNGREILSGLRYVPAENDRAILTRDGSIILALYELDRMEGRYAGIGGPSRCIFLRSEDGGRSFTESEAYYCPDPSLKSGIQENGVVQSDDGTIMAYARTDGGYQCVAYSYDDGRTFSPFEASDIFISPCSPMTVSRLADGRIIAVYNDHVPTEQELKSGIVNTWSGRSPLVYRTSRDLKNWSDPVTLEPRCQTKNYCYTGVFSTDEFVLLGYCASDTVTDGGTLNRLRISRLTLGEIK